MNFPHPRIIDSSLSSALSAGCDCVMFKHDGFPVVINCAAHTANIFSHFREHNEKIDTVALTEPLDALLIGAKSPRTPVIYLYDTWWLNGTGCQQLSYRERYVLTRLNAKKLDERFVPVVVYPIQAAPELWKDVMKDPMNLKGLVFRRSKDTAAGDLFVKRFYAEAPEGLE